MSTATKEKLRKTYDKVRLLSLATPRARNQLIRCGDKELINCICECCVNILQGKVPLTPKQKSRLSRHKNKLRTLAKRRTSVRQKKEVIQKGGFLGLILPAVAGVLGGLLSSGGGGGS